MADNIVSGGTESTLSSWAAPYVTNLLGQTAAYGATGATPYAPPLTAGPSSLQQQAFQGISGLTTPQGLQTAQQQTQDVYSTLRDQPSYQAGQFNTGLGPVGSVQDYMSPYLQGVLDPQLREARRQADIQRTQDAARLVGSGAFGGSRQAIMEAEGERNLLTRLGDITGTGYQSAYDRAQQQRLAEAGLGLQAQQAGEASRQFGANLGLQGLQQRLGAASQLGSLAGQQQQYGLQNLQAMLGAGATQRDIEQQGLTADYNEFLRQEQDPLKKIQLQQSVLAGLPIQAANFYQPEPSTASAILGGALSGLSAASLLSALSGGSGGGGNTGILKLLGIS